MRFAQVRLVAVTVLVAVLIGCQQSSANQTAIRDKNLWVSPDAKNVKVFGTGAEVSFEVPEPYAATNLRVLLDNQYHPPIWTAVDELAVFGGTKTSDYPGGWREYVQGDQSIRMWARNWRNAEGTTVTYIIRYRWPVTQKEQVGGSAEVQAAVMYRSK